MGQNMLMIVGQISDPEAKEIDFIIKSLIVANRTKLLAQEMKKKNIPDD